MNDIANIPDYHPLSSLYALLFLGLPSLKRECVIIHTVINLHAILKVFNFFRFGCMVFWSRSKNICFFVLYLSCKCTCIFHSLSVLQLQISASFNFPWEINKECGPAAFMPSARARRRKKRITFLSIFQSLQVTYQLTSPKSAAAVGLQRPKKVTLKNKTKVLLFVILLLTAFTTLFVCPQLSCPPLRVMIHLVRDWTSF